MLGGFYLGQLYLGLSGGVGGGELTVQDTSHSHEAENVELKQNHVLEVQSTLHGHTASGNLVIVENKTLVVQNTLHGHVAESVTPTQKHVLAVNNTLHGHTAQSATLAVFILLSVADTLHGHIATSPSINQFTLLNKPNDTHHGFTSDNVDISQNYILEVQDTFHKHIASSILKIINWTELGVDFGNYKPGWNNSGKLTVAELDGAGIYIPSRDQDGAFELTDITGGILIPNNIQKGKF